MRDAMIGLLIDKVKFVVDILTKNQVWHTTKGQYKQARFRHIAECTGDFIL
jgi:hypothetical protein